MTDPRTAAAPCRGFTAIELLCTIAIAALTLAVGLPSLQRMLVGHTISARVAAFTSALRLARSEAVKRGDTVTFCVARVPRAATPTCAAAAQSSWEDGWLVFVDHDELGRFDDGDRLLLREDAWRPGVRVAANRRVVSFRASGVAVSGTGSYLFAPLADADAALGRTVCVNKQGRARVVTGACA